MTKKHEELCPSCDSKRVLQFRHDSDWGSGNSAYCVNSAENYEPGDEDINIDMNMCYCVSCGNTWW